jgi:hypothetical protein
MQGKENPTQLHTTTFQNLYQIGGNRVHERTFFWGAHKVKNPFMIETQNTCALLCPRQEKMCSGASTKKR